MADPPHRAIRAGSFRTEEPSGDRRSMTRSDPVGRARRYDWWSRRPRALRWLYRIAFLGREGAFRRRSIEALDPAPGERILEIGCGRGVGFPPIREGITDTGRLVGLDASRGMVEAARDRVRDAGWDNVHVVRGDARRLPFVPGEFDAVYAAMSLSAVSDPRAAIEAAKAVLRRGGRLVLLDARPFEAPALRPLNLLAGPVARYATNWVPEVDLISAVSGSFDTTDVSRFNAGSIVVIRARTGAGA